MKMYICILDTVPDNFVPVIAAHASLALYLKFGNLSLMDEWLATSFKKCVVSVNQKEFDAAKNFEHNVVLTESALGGSEVCVALTPRKEWPKAVKFYKLWKPK